MKEAILFKDLNQLESQATRVSTLAEREESKFAYHSVQDVNGIHEYEYEVSDGGALEAVLFQGVSLEREVLIRIKTKLGKNASLKITLIQEGASKSHIEIESEIKGQGAKLEIFGLQNAKAKQKFLFKANALHSVPHTNSDLQVWSVARDESQSIFNGLVTIEQTAPFTEAFQKNKNLILSERATIDSFPKLLIANDNVKCAHGSSTSTLEPDQFYYLQTRGIDREQAEAMLVKGFLRQALSFISDLKTKNELELKLSIQEEEWS